MVESPQSFIVSTECQKAAEQNGFRRSLGENNGWAAFQSTTAEGTIWLAASGASGPWFLALEHAGVIEELGSPSLEMPGPGLASYGRVRDWRQGRSCGVRPQDAPPAVRPVSRRAGPLG